MYDFLIVGAGLFGAVCARELIDSGKSVLVVDKRSHIGGQCYTEKRDDQIVNLYGAHIFHTNDERLWQYVNRFVRFRQYTHHVKAKAGETVYSFPPNRMTYQQAGTDDIEAMRRLFFVGYTEKMWGRPYGDVPESVTRRIPIRSDWDDRYYADKFQGMPECGYTGLIGKMLEGAEVCLNTDYLALRYELNSIAKRVIYSGPIDALYDCDLGRLQWRGMRFELRREEVETYQGCATMNYCDIGVEWLREEEYKYFYPPESKLPYSWISRHYPDSTEQLYPVNDDTNTRLAAAYKARAEAQGYIVGGRLGNYQYIDMHQVVAQALQIVKKVIA